ncbi:MAG: thiamine pyrophosphate-dependent dehydrogenase E1 component subunit alpha [Chloroflexi bacterium]|nr:thiamine pyrophosphate-dependent dehydrogenase E1 component subunit alpha [Chloroflexota bacterium]
MKERPGSASQPIAIGRPGAALATAGLTNADLRSMYYWMCLARALDARAWILNRTGKVAFVISCQGQEAAQIGAAMAFQRGADWFLPYYRDLGVVLVAGMTPREVMLASFARAADPNSGGRQMPNHWGCRRLHIVTASSPVATQLLHATGVALAAKLRCEPSAVFVSFGEGSSAGGDFHEAMNFAGIYRLPVVFFCENNGYAISVPQARELAIQNVADRAAGYGFPGVVVDGTDPIAVHAVTRDAVERARRGDGPTLIEAKCVRLTGHSSDDDERRYRSPEEIESARRRDPVPRFRRLLLEHGVLDEASEREIQERVALAVDDATEFAEGSPMPLPETAALHVYHEEGGHGS